MVFSSGSPDRYSLSNDSRPHVSDRRTQHRLKCLYVEELLTSMCSRCSLLVYPFLLNTKKCWSHTSCPSLFKNELFLPRTCRGPCVFILNIRSARDRVWEIGGSMFPRCVIFHRTVASPTLFSSLLHNTPTVAFESFR